MPSSRMPKSMAEKKEVVQWIEKNGGVPTPAAVYFKNERDWKVSEAQMTSLSARWQQLGFLQDLEIGMWRGTTFIGELFCSKWNERIEENADDVSDNGGALSEDCFDEFTIWDSEESV
ncbi:hypothetical protein PF010_g10182 [Phytophthora fragariae]|uniref:Uncharacterized protein n=1 Tax=Phytophthora fragariae TaxID=53985 RepID=A0A6A3KIX6_9STRA|nr:hypothetical protein PF011_g11189 [Phytophthora fragariae]KAE9113181.1 hypothetical protein PF010_g10182 [Phytophthora fragariae]KAE9233049.1 hypothetical protein PF004_g9750 [Phytophthora fragariae]KAE9342852.1 hypothetical protein PF008_g9967 [Phytophthora fragariae]